ALAVVHELDAVDAARERGGVRLVAALVRGEDVRDVAEALHAPGDLLLVEALLLEVRRGALDVAVHVEDARAHRAPGAPARRDETRSLGEKAPEPIPVALLRSGTRDDVVHRSDDGLGRRDIGLPRGRALRGNWRRACYG